MVDKSKLPNAFEFVVTAGARARQLLAGSIPRVEPGDSKVVTVAQREVLTGAVERIREGSEGAEGGEQVEVEDVRVEDVE